MWSPSAMSHFAAPYDVVYMNMDDGFICFIRALYIFYILKFIF